MIWAEKNNKRIKAIPGEKAICPACRNDVLAKCGSIKIHHWSHIANCDCPQWEPETDWHRQWKARFPEEWQEVIMKNHRADVKTPNCVIEFQHSSISPEEIREREEFYGKMIWVVDASPFIERLEIRKRWQYVDFDEPEYMVPMWDDSTWAPLRPTRWKHSPWWSLEWKHMRKSWLAAERPVILDLGAVLFRIERFPNNYSGTGTPLNIKTFLTTVSTKTKKQLSNFHNK